jgi:hypothetical protein
MRYQILQDGEMRRLEDIDFSRAELSFAVANTPSFLIRKLKSDPAVIELSHFEGNELLNWLMESVRNRPTSLVQAVKPYVYLIAIASKLDNQFLIRAGDIKPAYEDDWYPYIYRVLTESYKPTTTTIFSLSPGAVASNSAIHSATVFN